MAETRGPSTTDAPGRELQTEQWMLNLVDEIAIQNIPGQRKMIRQDLARNKRWKDRNPIEVECEVENRIRSNLLNIVKAHLPC